MKLSIWITRKCNLNCSYCYEDGIIREDVSIIEEDYIEKCIEFINLTCYKTSSTKLFIKFFGGEPLLKFDFIKKFVDNINKKVSSQIKVFYSITTNGTLMTNEMIEWFKSNDVECALSIDGDENVYTINRHYANGKSSWKTVDKLISELISKNLKLSGRMTYNAKTASFLYDSCQYLIKRGFTVLKAVPDYFDKNWTPELISILEKEVIKVNEIVSLNSNVQINLDDDDLFIGRKGCAGGYSMFSIDINGDIYPCTYAVGNAQFILGNVYNNCNINLEYTDGTHLTRKDCLGCRYYLCCKSASCLYGNYKMTGKMDQVNNFYCSYRKILYKIKER